MYLIFLLGLLWCEKYEAQAYKFWVFLDCDSIAKGAILLFYS